jgi:TolB protein
MCQVPSNSPRSSSTLCVLLCSTFFAFGSPAASAHDNNEQASRAVGAIFPQLSPSGKSVVFSYQGAIWRMPSEGGAMLQLTDDEGLDIEPIWSHDESLIAYINSRNLQGGRLRVIRADNGSRVELPREINVRDKLHFDVSGRRILGNFQDENQNFVLAWFDLENGRLAEPVQISAGRQKHALSHDQQWIATTTSLDEPGQQSGNNGPQVDLWKVPVAGGERQLIVRFPARIYDLCWAADGQSLYVVTDLGGAHNDLWQIPLDDPQRSARKLTFGQADEDCPSVSRDGRWLLITDNRFGATALVRRDLSEGRSDWLQVAEMRFRRPTGTLQLAIRDQPTGEPVTSRVSVQQAGGKYYAPPGSLYRLLNADLHFYVAGQTQWALPAGAYQIQCVRGPEYRVARCEVEIRPDQTTVVPVELERWINQSARGWHSGENHIHANYGYGHWYNTPRTMLHQCAGEDLVVCNFVVANSDGDGVYDREFFRGRPDPLSTPRTVLYWNEEFRSTIWGHMTLVNLKQLVEPIFTGFEHTTHPHDHPTNADIADLTHDQGGHVNYTHPAQDPRDPYQGAYTAKSLPLDVALGKIDSIDVMGSNHVANLPLWYRLLNCGFHVPASAGTDCFLNRIPSRVPGGDRVYVQVDGEFTYEDWIKQLQAGRTFVTNGPMLELAVDGGGIGERLQRKSATEVQVTGRVQSQYKLDRVELVYNGQVVAHIDVGNGRDVPVSHKLLLDKTGWLALRAAGPAHADQPRGDVFAHTSPIYIEIESTPLDAREDAEYFLTWSDRLWDDVRRRDRIPPRYRAKVESQIFAAREVFSRLARREGN